MSDALKAFKGIGNVGASIFLREVQGVWTEFYTYTDPASLKAAKKLDLPDAASALAEFVDQQQFPRLIAVLARTQLAEDFDAVRQVAW